MDANTAYQTLMSLPPARGAHQDSPLLMSHLVPAYAAADSATRGRVNDALIALFDSENPDHRSLAVEFAVGAKLDASAVTELAKRYLAGANPSIAQYFASNYYGELPAEAAEILHQRFLSNPLAERGLLLIALRFRNDEATWAAIERVVEETEQPAELARLYEAMLAKQRDLDYLRILAKTKSQDQIDAFLALMPDYVAADLATLT